MIDKLYNTLINRKPIIYQKYRAHRRGRRGISILGSWFYLLKINLSDVIFKGKYNDNKGNGRSTLREEISESLVVKRDSIQELAHKCELYDVISFDVFDTLLFRAVCEPSDAFHCIGERLNQPNFEQIRREAERRARLFKKKKKDTVEVNLEEIWQLIEAETGINQIEGLETELEVEENMCFANPYMLELLKVLSNRNKRMVVISDMYLSKEQIQTLLQTSSIPDVFEEIYVSSEYNCSKNDGRLYDIVKEKLGQEWKYFHIGDNEYADVVQAKKHGFTSYYYQNVNDAGEAYRPDHCSSLSRSVYNGLVNAYIHNGLRSYSKIYELGFIYGGAIASYCEQQGTIKELEQNQAQLVDMLFEVKQPEFEQGVKDFIDYYMLRMKKEPKLSGEDIHTIIDILERHMSIVKKILV